MSSPKDEEKPLEETHDETRDHADGDNDEVRRSRAADGAAALAPPQKRKEQKSKRGG